MVGLLSTALPPRLSLDLDAEPVSVSDLQSQIGNLGRHRASPPTSRGWGWRITKTFVRYGRRWEYHATKGWRSYRL